MNSSTLEITSNTAAKSYSIIASEDGRLVTRSQAGDNEAIEALWKKYHPLLVKYFVSTVGSREESEDLASDTLLAILRNINRFRGSSTSASNGTSARSCTLKTYVLAAANLRLKYWWRQRATRERSNAGLSSDSLTPSQEASTMRATDQPLQAQMSECSDPLQLLMRKDQLDRTHYALADVGLRSCEQFKALVFHYGCGLQHREIAELLDTRKETINTRVQEGRNALRTRHLYV